jgi:competence protein ComEA
MTRRLLLVLVPALLLALGGPARAAVDANTATEAELDSVRGIGPVTSRAILAERRKGAYASWDDLLARVRGLGPERAQALSEAGLRVGGQSYRR